MVELTKKYSLAEELLSHPQLNEFIAAGFITETNIRNCHIIKDYGNLRKTLNHLDTLEELSIKYYLSQERILSILYR